MIIVDAPLSLDLIEQQQRRRLLGVLSSVHLVYEVESVAEFRAWVDQNLKEMEEAGFAPYLRRVILIGRFDGEVCKLIRERIAPGSSFKALPVPETWAWLWEHRQQILDVARKAG